MCRPLGFDLKTFNCSTQKAVSGTPTPLEHKTLNLNHILSYLALIYNLRQKTCFNSLSEFLKENLLFYLYTICSKNFFFLILKMILSYNIYFDTKHTETQFILFKNIFKYLFTKILLYSLVCHFKTWFPNLFLKRPPLKKLRNLWPSPAKFLKKLPVKPP